MSHEQQRRAYLQAMQVTTWLPRVALPFAAPSNAEVLAWVDEPPAPNPILPAVAKNLAAAPAPVAANAAVKPAPKPAVAADLKAALVSDTPPPAPAAKPSKAPSKARVPRFALQLLRAGRCLVLLDSPTGMALQSRDPAYLLLKDMLRAAQLTDKPLLVGDGEPIRWPLLKNSRVDQGPQAARDYVQGVLQAEMAREGCELIWLLGTNALNYGAELSEQSFNQVVPVAGLLDVWALPSLELLMDEPLRKAPLWQAMQSLIPRWTVK